MFDQGHFRYQIGDLHERRLGVASGYHHVLLPGLVFQRLEHLLEGQVIIAQYDIEFVENYHVIARIGDHFLGCLPRPARRGDIAGAVLGVPGEALAHGLQCDELGEAGENGAFAGLPHALDELDDPDPHAVANRPDRQAEGGGRLALALAGIDDDEAAFFRLGRQDFVPGRLLLRHLLGVTAVEFGFAEPFRILHGPSPRLPPANSDNMPWAAFERGRHRPRVCASSKRSLISLSAAGLCSAMKARTASSLI